MLPTETDNEPMDPDTLATVFQLFGKGVTQMVQKDVLQQAMIDELRSQVRALQVQITNLTANMDEMEDRILIKMQSQQPTLFTREGIPIDDALDALTNRAQTTEEHLKAAIEQVNRFDADLASKVDKEEFITVADESQKSSEAFTDISATVHVLQKDVQKLRNEFGDSQDKILQTVRLQIQNSSTIEDTKIEDLGSNYVTHEELQNVLMNIQPLEQKIRLKKSGLLDFLFTDDGVTEDKIEQAYQILQQKGEELDPDDEEGRKQLEDDYQRLIKVIENRQTEQEEEDRGDKGEEDGNEEEGEEEDIDGVWSDYVEQKEYVDVAIDKEEAEITSTHIRQPTFGESRRSIGLQIYEVNIDDYNEEEEEPSIDIEEAEVPQRRIRSKKQSRMGKVVAQLKKEKDGLAQMRQTQNTTTKVDENRIAQAVFDQLMPRFEVLMTEGLNMAAPSSGVQLNKNDAKVMIAQLQSLNDVQKEVKELKLKVSMKLDKGKADQEFALRVTREELFKILADIFPDNSSITQLTHSALPPLKRTNSPRGDVVERLPSESGVVIKSTTKTQSPKNLKPARQSRLLALNQRYLKGADGRYYLRDLSTDIPLDGSLRESQDISATYDFLPFHEVPQQLDDEQGSLAAKLNREKTPVDSRF